MAYVGIGGSLTSAELEEALQGRRSLSDHEHDVVAQALNDHFTSIGQDHPVAYSHELAEHGRRGRSPDRARCRRTEARGRPTGGRTRGGRHDPGWAATGCGCRHLVAAPVRRRHRDAVEVPADELGT
jgi:hypothetical protein